MGKGEVFNRVYYHNISMGMQKFTIQKFSVSKTFC